MNISILSRRVYSFHLPRVSIIHSHDNIRIHVFNDRKQYHNQYHNYGKSSHKLQFTAIGVTIGSVILWLNKRHKLYAKESQTFGDEIPGLKKYTSAEISQHNHKSKRIWVSFKSGVYDITDFVGEHPGGDAIMMAAGGQLEPFWQLYAIHKTESVLRLLETYRIGNLVEEDRQTATAGDDPFANEPRRHPALRVSSSTPFCAETPLSILTDSFLTPNGLFYVRNHLPVPEIDLKTYAIEVNDFEFGVTLTLNDIKTLFPKHTITTTIQCAGNRRSELNQIKEVKGLSWSSGAIGTAEWSGARLVDVLEYCKVNANNSKVKHIQFEGLDFDVSSNPYGASVPADIALDPKANFLLAYEMNGEDIPIDHGFPLRLIAPGIVGARNVKWLKSITVSDEESSSHWQRRDYKSFSPSIDLHNVDWNSAPAIQDLPVQSAMCDPLDGQTVRVDPTGRVSMRGYAYSGGGRKVIRVDVSADGGQHWFTADLEQESTPLNRTYSWTLWRAKIPMSDKWKSGDRLQLICRAVDSAYNTQPENPNHVWNFRGVLNNSWHKINVTLL